MDLGPDQVLRAESGAMLYMTEGIAMETSTGGGLSQGFQRMLTGQNLFLSDFRYAGTSGTTGRVALGTDFPSKILRLRLQDYHGDKIVCQKGALLCASHTVDIQMEFAKKLTAGFFGGEGFVLQGLTGTGDVFVKAGGTVIKKVLGDGETLRVSSGCLVAFENGVEFDVQTMPGFKNVVFGGEGLFVTTLTGPGTIWLQGMPPDRMINEIARRVPSGGGIGLGLPIGMGMGGGGGEESAGEEDEGGEAMAASDAAIEADRNATVATSGMGTEDPDSASALFGDATDTDSGRTTNASESNDFSSTSDDMSSSSTTFGDDLSPQDDFDDSTFSTQDDDSLNADFDDGFSQKDSFDTEESFSSGDAVDGVDDGSSGSNILGTLWDLFTGGGDE